MERIPDKEMIDHLNEVLTKVKENKDIDMTDFKMILTVSSVALARLVEDKYLRIINNGGAVKESENIYKNLKGKADGDDTRKEGKEKSN